MGKRWPVLDARGARDKQQSADAPQSFQGRKENGRPRGGRPLPNNYPADRPAQNSSLAPIWICQRDKSE
jgi:hypothetical protein